MNFSMLRPALRAASCSAAALAALLLAPGAASAAVSCQHDFLFHTINISLTEKADRAAIKRNANGEISVNMAPCNGATVENVDGIYVTDTSGQFTTVQIDATEGTFAPAGSPASEIEFWIDLGTGPMDDVTVEGDEHGATIVLGDQRINLNSAEEPAGAQDFDVALSGVEFVAARGSSAADWISAEGGRGTGKPYAGESSLFGDSGDDELRATDAHYASINGGSGDDVLQGGTQSDFLTGGPGNDTISGGAGADLAFYSAAVTGVSVDLSITGPQDTRGAGTDTLTGVERLSGSSHDDLLRGDGFANTLSGNGGSDVLEARGGDDSLVGDDGDDTLLGGAGDDSDDGGAGLDAVAFDDAAGPVTADLGIAVAQPTGAAGFEAIVGVEGLRGSPFGDRLTGSAGADTLAGGGGPDTIDGREGADTLAGGGGIDAIDSRDTSADAVSCGEGPDSLATDPLDTIAFDCVPAPPPADQPAPAAPPVLSVSVPRQSLRTVRAKGLRVILRCSADCRPSGRLLAPRATARRLGLARRMLGRLAPVALTAGTARSVRVPLTRAARGALRRASSARLAFKTQAADGAAPQTKIVKLRRSQ